jgi:DNA-binding transcriptional regulator GbsR (MarR family)
MTSEDRKRRQKEMVEIAGRFYDKKGLQPIAGRILGLLTVMDKEQFTFDEIVEELNISKSSASNALRLLEMSNSIEYITLPGDRKRYFQLKKSDKFALIDEYRNTISGTHDYLKMILELKADKHSANAIFIENLIDMLKFFLDKFDELKKEYTRSIV